LYFCSPVRWKNGVALVASCFFYAWGAPQFFFILIFALITDYYLVRLMLYSDNTIKKWLLGLSLFINIGLLAIAKYLNFFIDTANSLLQVVEIGGIPLVNIILPIGISFITFQKISYVIDCYREKVEPLKNIFDYGLYILFFPQLIAGPIVRFNEIADQLINRHHQEKIDHKLSGLFRFITGLAKKVLLANTLGIVVDEVFMLSPENIQSGLAWIAILAYSLQIYFDFSGYSDMAIGIALMLGFKFPENFNFPYNATTITNFWQRWHITLSNWMRDYLYIPLGGNRVTKRRLYFNLWTVFLISGLWHGAAWTFILWGAWHGLFLILDRIFLKDFLERMGRIPAIAITFLIVLIGWVFFRSPNIGYAFDYLNRMFAFDFASPAIFIDQKFWMIFIISLSLILASLVRSVEQTVTNWYDNTQHLGWLVFKSLTTIIIALICIVNIFASDFNPFIYFKF
jgi:alginate O-acetyltransferase complex protein AlgI